MKRAKVVFGQPYPSRSVDGRPQITRQASAQTLTVVLNLDQRLMTLVAVDGAEFRHDAAYHKPNPCLRAAVQ